MNHETRPYPHPGGCAECRARGVCNFCSADARRPADRCTNGRCLTCHLEQCTRGGSEAAGHGYGGNTPTR